MADERKEERRAWTAPELSFDGELHDLVIGGTGKNSTSSSDTGDSGKPRGQG